MKKIFTLLFIAMSFSVFSQKDLTILFVNDNDATPAIVDSMRHAITNSGYSFVNYDAPTNGVPTYDLLIAYDLVIWSTGNDGSSRFWDKSNSADIKANAGLMSYLSEGGMLWLEGIDFMYDAFSGAIDTFTSGSFTYDYLGVYIYAGQAHVNDKVVYDGLPMMTAVEGNGICSKDTVTWRWSTMYYADAIEPTVNAKPIYKMGPADYDLAKYYSAIYNEKGDAKVLSFFIRADGYKTAEMGKEITTQVLDYFNQFAAGAKIEVSSVDIHSTNGFTITENNGNLQLSATVLPEDATNKSVTWSIAEGSVNSMIDQNGLLTASGLDNANGIVYVVAKSNDGTEISDTAEVTISGQTLGNSYKVLLVNDNDKGIDRYLDIDTAVAASEYTYKTYNSVAEGVAPNYDYLTNFDFVIWYTGNDGVGLKFWDVSDSSDIKCNAALKQFADEGGVVWVQGLDFLYDVFGNKYSGINGAEDSIIHAFEAGDFVNDYLGIKSYVAQSHSNETSGNYVGVQQLDLTDENKITTLNPIKWAYTEMWYVDAIDKTDSATALYYMGPETYDFALYYAMLYNKNGNAHFISSTFETARLDNQENTNKLVKDVIDYFEALENQTDVEKVDKNKIGLNVYPNPTNGNIKIEISSTSFISKKIVITDLTGKVVFEEIPSHHTNGTPIEVNLNHLDAGIYNLTIFGSGEYTNQRIVVF
jgi:hypothetical protein